MYVFTEIRKIWFPKNFIIIYAVYYKLFYHNIVCMFIKY